MPRAAAAAAAAAVAVSLLLCTRTLASAGPAASAATPASPKPHVVFIVADDLGYQDLGALNGNRTITPRLDRLLSDGVRLTDYYTYKVCAPSRASMLSGRMPYNVGFFDMSHDGEHCINASTQLLPAVMRQQGYRAHATGKYDVGYVKSHCTPTARGFETFLGYYTACTSDYWYHGAPGGNETMSPCGGVDFSNSTESGGIDGATMRGPGSVNGTYDQDVFTQRAIDVIEAHNTSESLFLYVAYHNVHDACTKDRFALGLHAPGATVERYATTKLDTWKVQAAMTTELDYGVANITEALVRRGMYENTVIVFVSDNGGPLDHSNNAPLRSGKGHWYEGGVRVTAAIESPLLPTAVRGTEWHGIAHASDWYVTMVEGIAGGDLPADTGPHPPDGFNLWPALLSNGTSPRTEVIHGVNGSQVIPPVSKDQCASCSSLAARFGDYKIILGINPNETQPVQAWPNHAAKPIPFGQSGGKVEAGTDHYRAPLLDAAATKSTADEVAGTPGPDVEGGHNDVMLFHLPTDLSESKNLAGDPQYASLIASFRQRLKAAAEAAPVPAFVIVPNATQEQCAREEKWGFLEPLDWEGPHSTAQSTWSDGAAAAAGSATTESVTPGRERPASTSASNVEKGIIYVQPSYYYTNTLQLNEAVAEADFATMAAAGTVNVGLRIAPGDLITAWDFATGAATYNESACTKLAWLAGLAADHGMRLVFNTHIVENVPAGTPNATWRKPFTDEAGVVHRGTWSVADDVLLRADCRPFILEFHRKFAQCLSSPRAAAGVHWWKHAFESCYLFPSPAAAKSEPARAAFARWAQDTNASLNHWRTRWQQPQLASFADIVPPTAESGPHAGYTAFVSDYWRFWLLGVLREGTYGTSIGDIYTALAKGASVHGSALKPQLGFKHWKPHNFLQDTDLTLAELRRAFDLPINVTALGQYVNSPADLAAEPAALESYINTTRMLAPADLPLLVWETGGSTFNLTQAQQAQWARIMRDTVSRLGVGGYNYWQFVDWSPQQGVPDKQIFHFGAHFNNGTAKEVWSVLQEPMAV